MPSTYLNEFRRAFSRINGLSSSGTGRARRQRKSSYECAEPNNAGSRTQVGDSTHHPGPPRVACRRRSDRHDVRLAAFLRSSPPGGCSYLRPVSVTPRDVA
ncbi:hypothetical protein AAC387_Pa01g4058 [Persea americana]